MLTYLDRLLALLTQEQPLLLSVVMACFQQPLQIGMPLHFSPLVWDAPHPPTMQSTQHLDVTVLYISLACSYLNYLVQLHKLAEHIGTSSAEDRVLHLPQYPAIIHKINNKNIIFSTVSEQDKYGKCLYLYCIFRNCHVAPYLLCVHIHLLSSDWERTSVIVEIFRIILLVLMCAFPPEISFLSFPIFCVKFNLVLWYFPFYIKLNI